MRLIKVTNMPKIDTPNDVEGINVVHPGRQKDDQELASFWQKYLEGYPVINKIAAIDILEDKAVRDISLTGEYKSDCGTLKGVLTPDGYRKLLARFRKWVSRQRNQLSSISLRKETLERIKTVAEKSGFRQDDYDLMFEYLLDSPEQFESAKEFISDLPMGLTTEDQHGLLLNFLQHEQFRVYQRIRSLVDYAYNSGWHDCRRRKGRRKVEHAESDFVTFWLATTERK